MMNDKLDRFADKFSVEKILVISISFAALSAAVFILLDSAEKTPGIDSEFLQGSEEVENLTCQPPYTRQACYPEVNETSIYAGQNDTVNVSQAEKICQSNNGTIQTRQSNQSNASYVYCVM